MYFGLVRRNLFRMFNLSNFAGRIRRSKSFAFSSNVFLSKAGFLVSNIYNLDNNLIKSHEYIKLKK